MKLGIVVVYLFDEENEALVDLHLNRISRHTDVPYTIYGSANRVAPRFRRRLASEPNLHICGCPDTAHRGKREHSHYLDHLVRIAAEDDVTHIVTLHLDSFPVSDGWAIELARKLSQDRVLATIDRISTACLLFSRDFYLAHRPSFWPAEAETLDASYRSYLAEHDPHRHSGVGFGFEAYRNGLSWHYMLETSRDGPGGIARIYDDAVFHLGGAAKSAGQTSGSMIRRTAGAATAIAKRVLPVPAREVIRTRFSAPIDRLIDRPRSRDRARRVRELRERLLADPDAYLNSLRDRA